MIVSPGGETRKRYAKWSRLFPGKYVYVCSRGCHGHEADTVNEALTHKAMVEDQCKADANSQGNLDALLNYGQG